MESTLRLTGQGRNSISLCLLTLLLCFGEEIPHGTAHVYLHFLARRRKMDLNGLKPDAVRSLSVTGERKVDLSFLRDHPNLEAAALQLADRSEWRYGGIQKAFAAAGKSPLLREEISTLTTWLSL